MTYTKGTNQFSDLLESEWLALVPGCRINVTSSSGHGDKHARRGRVSTWRPLLGRDLTVGGRYYG